MRSRHKSLLCDNGDLCWYVLSMWNNVCVYRKPLHPHMLQSLISMVKEKMRINNVVLLPSFVSWMGSLSIGTVGQSMEAFSSQLVYFVSDYLRWLLFEELNLPLGSWGRESLGRADKHVPPHTIYLYWKLGNKLRSTYEFILLTNTHIGVRCTHFSTHALRYW